MHTFSERHWHRVECHFMIKINQVSIPFLLSFKIKEKFQILVSIHISLVSLFNGISTFVDYLMPKPSLWKTAVILFKSLLEEIRAFIPFSRGISPKVNVIARLAFELVYFEVAEQQLSHYAMRTPCPLNHWFLVTCGSTHRAYLGKE